MQAQDENSSAIIWGIGFFVATSIWMCMRLPPFVLGPAILALPYSISHQGFFVDSGRHGMTSVSFLFWLGSLILEVGAVIMAVLFVLAHRRTNNSDPKVSNMAENEELKKIIADCPNLHIWRLGDPIVFTAGSRLLVGLEPWSPEDRKQLLAMKVEANKQQIPIRVDIFFPEADLDQYIPGMATVYLSPFLGIWVDGVLKEKAWGVEARKRLDEIIKNSFEI